MGKECNTCGAYLHDESTKHELRDYYALLLAVTQEGIDATSRITGRAIELREHPVVLRRMSEKYSQ